MKFTNNSHAIKSINMVNNSSNSDNKNRLGPGHHGPVGGSVPGSTRMILLKKGPRPGDVRTDADGARESWSAEI
ncbi:hypothetical protein RRG08_054726 [Elysia crispata]|uniref:Uncharacterized protein n=1 Tax=Elysia crispata TaxID=231223 RepID=A0AAE1B0T4_9GAST|nr:hypothetical protein RRG08_054726 [Elysia crispata]